MRQIISALLRGELTKLTFNYEGVFGARHDEVVEVAYNTTNTTFVVKFYEAVYDLGDVVPVYRYTAEVCVHEDHWHWRLRHNQFDQPTINLTERHVKLLGEITKEIDGLVFG